MRKNNNFVEGTGGQRERERDKSVCAEAIEMKDRTLTLIDAEKGRQDNGARTAPHRTAWTYRLQSFHERIEVVRCVDRIQHTAIAGNDDNHRSGDSEQTTQASEPERRLVAHQALRMRSKQAACAQRLRAGFHCSATQLEQFTSW